LRQELSPSADPGIDRTMHVQPIPDQDERRADLATELANEGEELGRIDVLVGEQREDETHPVPAGRDGQGGDHGDALVRPFALVENRCLPDRAQVFRTSGAMRRSLSSRKTIVAFSLLARSMGHYLCVSRYEPGDHARRWNGRDANGDPVQAGIYFVVVRGGGHSQSGKIVVVK